MGKYLQEYLKTMAHRSFKIGQMEVECEEVDPDEALKYRYFPSISKE
jgi:hypothetical protein